MKKKRQLMGNSINLIITAILSFLFLFPIFYALMSSFKTNGEILKDPLAVPVRLNLDNFIYLFQETNFISSMKNSIMITVMSMILIILLIPMAAYGIERKKTRSSSLIYSLFVAGMMIPFQVYMVPLFKELKMIGIFGTMAAPIMIYIAGTASFGVLLYCSFIRGVPKELEESAAIDGCGRMRIFWNIVFPLLKPCTSSMIIINSLAIWNDFLMPSLVLSSRTGSTINVEIFSFVDQFTSRWDVVFAGTTCAIIPLLVVFMCLQKHFIKGIAAGAIKG